MNEQCRTGDSFTLCFSSDKTNILAQTKTSEIDIWNAIVEPSRILIRLN